MYVYPYNSGSKSARALANALDGKMIRREGSKFQGSPGKVVINWGCAEVSREVRNCRIINNPAAVALAHNKLQTFKALAQSGVECVPWTQSQATAQGWLDQGFTVMARKSLTGHSGHDIEVLERGDWEEAPLYTQYVPKDREYRIHVVRGEIIDVQRKVKDPKVQDVKSWKVRSHDNGFIFIRNDDSGRAYKDQLEPGVAQNAINCCRNLGLDFAAVDIIYSRKRSRSYILEANTAPGLEGHTIEVYARALGKLG